MAEITTTDRTCMLDHLLTKTCTLDHPLTKQLNDNMESVVLIITYITNASLDNAVMSVVPKQAIVRSLVKKTITRQEHTQQLPSS